MMLDIMIIDVCVTVVAIVMENKPSSYYSTGQGINTMLND